MTRSLDAITRGGLGERACGASLSRATYSPAPVGVLAWVACIRLHRSARTIHHYDHTYCGRLTSPGPCWCKLACFNLFTPDDARASIGLEWEVCREIGARLDAHLPSYCRFDRDTIQIYDDEPTHPGCRRLKASLATSAGVTPANQSVRWWPRPSGPLFLDR